MNMSRTLSDAERRDWLRLIRSESVGPVTFRQLLRRFKTARAALDALPDLARRGGRMRPPAIPSQPDVDAEIERLRKLGARLVALGEPEYPPALAAIEDAPPLLAVRGQADVLARPAIAIVGARNASANGVRFARQLAGDLGAAGYAVVSGLARGIDTGAHVGALMSGTVAVMAGGIDVIYPPENEGIYREIVQRGAVVSEMPPGLMPQARHFPRRNRIVSGIGLGVVVVEAALGSGSLITARFALEQGREVFAVPGSPLDPRARGTNDLLRQGATLTEGVADVVAVVARLTAREEALPAGDRLSEPPAEPAGTGEHDLDEARRRVAEKLGPAPVPVDEIIRQCQLAPAVVLTALLELELAGRLTRHPGNQVSG